ncbi:MAG: hypothetical protein MUF49_07195 [Oculatellaceae cyanobacterium Prado106]|jgi:tetratricopeptide (TPR) repeat protein|nr:hypothetical protein [Oculatellaceae cyanobacterium Prado106]
MTETNDQLAEQYFLSGKSAFERGQYRQSVEQLEKAVNLAGQNSKLGGEVQIWLVNAYQAAGQNLEAIALCEKLGAHPDLKTRKQSRRMIYILKAPKLKLKEEWMTKIPDLSNLDDPEGRPKGASQYVPVRTEASRKRSQPEPEPIDLSQVNTKDNDFVWIALGIVVLTLGGLIWFR